MSQSQNFTLGSNSVNISMGNGITTSGRNTTVTATTGSNGSGYSVAYNGNGTITLTFDTVVANLKFSIYDIDNSQFANVTAKDPAGNALNVSMTNLTPGLTLSGTATSPTLTAPNTNYPSTGTDYRGVVNLSIAGYAPAGTGGVKTVNINIGGTAGDFWLSDISACVYKPLPTNYYLVSKPFAGQPAYILNNSNAPTASTTDVATGNCRYVFKDNSGGNRYLNSLGYDPYQHILYYVWDARSSSPANKTIRKYDFNTLSANNATMSSGTASTVISDITAAPFNVPVFSQGVESGAGAFYGGSYYIGIEGADGGSSNTGRCSIIWRFDFDASNNATKASQAWAFPADNSSGKTIHNWSDFSISNGILYDFNSTDPSGSSGGQFTHCDLQSGLIVNMYLPNGSPVPGQSGTAWNENIYWLDNSNDNIALYNKNGTIGGMSPLTGKAAIDWTSSGSGDGSDAFKPPIDYGDAPASYDPASADPASHDYDSTITLGTLWNAEFAKKTSPNATGDGVTDDGLPSPPVFSNFQTSYTASVSVYNHSGAAVTVAGWIDMNNNGVFDPGEGTTATLSTSKTTLQTVVLSWSGTAIPLGVTRVFMRLRVTSASNGMTASTPTGYFSNGEVEDYVIPVSTVLQTTLLSFTASPVNNQYVQIAWQTASETNMQSYIIQRSQDGNSSWDDLQFVAPANAGDNGNIYTATDPRPLGGTSFYRLKMVSYSGDAGYSGIAKVTFKNGPIKLSLTPNPFKQNLSLTLNLPEANTVLVRLIDLNGNLVYAQSLSGSQGPNYITVTNLPALAKGIYVLEVTSGSYSVREKVFKE